MNKFLALAVLVLSLAVSAADRKPVRVLFDTDHLTDYDDVGALACLHALQPDGSVVLCTVGFLTNVRKLIDSGPDRFSPLPGEELMRRKVVRWVAMAGCPSGRPVT